MSDYPIGYGKPPKSGQFKKGQSGNPKGRPRKAPALADVLRKASRKKIAINTADGVRHIDKLTALVEKTLNDALKGDARARGEFLKLLREEGLQTGIQTKTAEAFERLQDEDREILTRWTSRSQSSSDDA